MLGAVSSLLIVITDNRSLFALLYLQAHVSQIFPLYAVDIVIVINYVTHRTN